MLARKLPLVAEDPQSLSLVPGARGDVSSLDGARRSLRSKLRVALVSMPFHSSSHPSIQLGLLSAIAETHGFTTDTFHLNLELARRVGTKLYEELCQHRGRLMGDWLFSVDAFREEAPDRDARFVTDFERDVARQLGEEPARLASPAVLLRSRLNVLRIRDEVVPAFLNAMMNEVDWSRYGVVGFTSVFQQTVASLALARRIKERHPHVRVIFGGANFDGEMGLELVRRVSWIDHAVVGEGDVALPELLVALAEGRDPTVIKGVASRVDGDVKYPGGRKLLEDLDQLPTPRYDEYFARAEATGLMSTARRRTAPIPFESARGCWWGEKHHCTFCGLNNNGMRFRAKSPDRVADELAELTRKYRSFRFDAVDNIVDHEYLKSLFPRIVDEKKDYKLFYEVKSNLTRDQIKTLREGGVWNIQPGIESLSSHVLKLMRKGVTAAQNVNTLRWATYYGIIVGWNVLWGFPGETIQDYEEQAKLFPLLRHLSPPGGGSRIWMERFSPVFMDRDAFPLEHRRPEASYAYVYPSNVDLDTIAYFFDYKLRNTLKDSAYIELDKQIRAWIEAWKTDGQRQGFGSGDDRRASTGSRPTLTYWSSDDFVQIADERGGDLQGSFTFEGPHARLYQAAVERPATLQKIIELADVKYPAAQVERALLEFCEQGVMMRDGERFLSLALPSVTGR